MEKDTNITLIKDIEREVISLRSDFQQLEQLFQNLIKTTDAKIEALEDELRKQVWKKP